MSAAWLKDAVFYEIYPQSFYDTNGDGIGDLNGIVEKLDYIRSLGCSAVSVSTWVGSFRQTRVAVTLLISSAHS